MKKQKVLVIGLDGATWDLLKPWAEEGKLPTIKKLMENGVWGELESTIPPVTGPAWVSFATGMNPGKTGVFDFVLPRKTLDDIKPISTKDIQSKTFYEILNRDNKKCILINLPCSYPPRTNDIIITSLLTKGDNFIFPSQLIEEIPELRDYRIVPDQSLPAEGKIPEYIKDIRNLEGNRFKCAQKLFKKEWDLFFILFSGIDWMQHIIYRELLSKEVKDIQEPLVAFKEIDEYIGWFIDNISSDTVVLVMSDHGFCTYNGTFFINEWLKKEGYLKIQLSSKSEVYSQKFVEEFAKVKAKKKIDIKLSNLALKFLKLFKLFIPFYKKIREFLPFQIRANVSPKLSETLAYSTTPEAMGIYLNTKDRFINGIIEEDGYKEIRDEIIEKLKEIKNPRTGEKIFENIWRKEEIYFGKYTNNAPDIIFVPRNLWIDSAFFKSLSCFENAPINKHSPKGILMAYGPDIKENKKINGAEIIDIAPTILHTIGSPLSQDMDGKVLKGIFKDDSDLAEREVDYQKIGEQEKIKQKINELKTLRR